MAEKIYVISIDPDTVASGMCCFNPRKKQIQTLIEIEFFDLFYVLNENKRFIWFVIIEGGWLNKKSNYHIYGKNEFGETVLKEQSKALGEFIAKEVGRNHQVGMLIVEMCKWLGIKHIVVRPRRPKVKKEYFEKLVGWKGKLTQDMADAGINAVEFNYNQNI